MGTLRELFFIFFGLELISIEPSRLRVGGNEKACNDEQVEQVNKLYLGHNSGIREILLKKFVKTSRYLENKRYLLQRKVGN